MEDTKFVEVSDQMNWCKAMVRRFGEADRAVRSRVREGVPLLEAVDANRRLKTGEVGRKLLVVDLQTEEGAIFVPSPEGDPKADLERHAIWVCPLFLAFLRWLYAHPDFEAIPALIELPNGDGVHFQGWRRPGPWFDGTGPLRDRFLEKLRAVATVPTTMVEIMIFFQAVTTESEFALLRAYLDSLSSQERNRWIGAVMSDSGRYIATSVGGTTIAYKAK